MRLPGLRSIQVVDSMDHKEVEPNAINNIEGQLAKQIAMTSLKLAFISSHKVPKYGKFHICVFVKR